MSPFVDLPGDLPERLARHAAGGSLREFQNLHPQDERQVPAAVLMPLIRRDHHWHLIYTLRSSLLHDHSGQVSFPGGSREPQYPYYVATALRDSQEEIGLNPRVVTVLGCLADMDMVTRFKVTPVVGVCEWPTPLTVNPDEVDRVFSIPIQWLADKQNRYFRVHTHLGRDFDAVYFKPYDGETVWGATATMTVELLNLLDL